MQKGITQQQVRDAFAVLTQYDFYLHGYFIYGNIGETEEEMLYIPKFAKEIKLDSISFQKLRIEKFSPLKEVVEANAGLLLQPYRRFRVFGPLRAQGAEANPEPDPVGVLRSTADHPYHQKSPANWACRWPRLDECIS